MSGSRSSPLNRAFGAIVPLAVDALDPDELVERLDLNAVLARVDLDAVLERIDLDALIGRMDIDALISRVDVDGLVAGIDLDALVRRLDLDRLMAGIDVSALVARIDVDAVISEVDIAALMARAGIDQIVSDATSGMATRTLDVLRRQLLGIDMLVLGGIDHMMRRPLVGDEASATITALGSDGAGSAALGSKDAGSAEAGSAAVGSEEAGTGAAASGAAEVALVSVDVTPVEVPATEVPPADVPLIDVATIDVTAIQGAALGARQWKAGPLSRTIGFLIDSATISVLFGLGVSLGGFLVGLFTNRSFQSTDGIGGVWLGAYLIWWFIYMWLSIALSGRTLGKGLVGLKVIAVDGSELSPKHAARRALAFPFSLILGLGFIPALFGRQRRAAHDYVAGSREIVDWGPRPVSPPARLAARAIGRPEPAAA